MGLQPFDIRSVMKSMSWDQGGHVIRATPSQEFWQAWNDNKIWMQNLGFRVHKTNQGWIVVVMDSSLIDTLKELA